MIWNQRKSKHNISCRNVRILINNQEGLSPAQGTALICKDIDKYGVDIDVFSETRLADDGQIQELILTIPPSGKLKHQMNEEKLVLLILTQIFVNYLVK